MTSVSVHQWSSIYIHSFPSKSTFFNTPFHLWPSSSILLSICDQGPQYSFPSKSKVFNTPFHLWPSSPYIAYSLYQIKLFPADFDIFISRCLTISLYHPSCIPFLSIYVSVLPYSSPSRSMLCPLPFCWCPCSFLILSLYVQALSYYFPYMYKLFPIPFHSYPSSFLFFPTSLFILISIPLCRNSLGCFPCHSSSLFLSFYHFFSIWPSLATLLDHLWSGTSLFPPIIGLAPPSSRSSLV